MVDNQPRIEVPEGINADVLVKRMMFLAWKACGRPLGMGVLQDRGPNQTEDQVWNAMYNRDDYPGGNDLSPNTANRPREVYADYVMGRMMKIGFEWDDKIITGSGEWRSDYQFFCPVYPDAKALAAAAVSELRAKNQFAQYKESRPGQFKIK